MPDDARNSSTHGCPSQKPPSSIEAASKTEKNDATNVGIGQQLETTSSVLTSGATSTSSIVVSDNKDDRLVAIKGNTSIQTTSRKRPAVDPKDDNGTPDPTGIINLLDDDNKEEEEEEEEEEDCSLINIDDTIKFPSLSPLSPPRSPSPTERPKKRTDIKRTPSKLDRRLSKIARSSDDRSKAVILSQKDEAKSGSLSTLKQSKLSFNRNGNVSMKINPRASSLLQPNSNNDRTGNRSTKSNSNSNNNNNKTDDNTNNNNYSNNEGNTKTDSDSLDELTPSSEPKKKDP
jgi:hypothetical protein